MGADLHVGRAMSSDHGCRDPKDSVSPGTPVSPGSHGAGMFPQGKSHEHPGFAWANATEWTRTSFGDTVPDAQGLAGSKSQVRNGLVTPSQIPCLADTQTRAVSPVQPLDGDQVVNGVKARGVQVPPGQPEGASERTQNLEPSRLSRILQAVWPLDPSLSEPQFCVSRGAVDTCSTAQTQR